MAGNQQGSVADTSFVCWKTMPLESVAFQTAQEHAPFTSPTIFFVSRFAKFKQFQIKNPKRDGRSNYVIKLSLTTFTERCRLVKPLPHVLGGKAKALSWQISKKTTPRSPTPPYTKFQLHHTKSLLKFFVLRCKLGRASTLLFGPPSFTHL